MTKGLDSSEAIELLKDIHKEEVKGERTPEQIHSAGQVVNIPGDNLGPLERAQRPALELKPGTMKKAMTFLENGNLDKLPYKGPDLGEGHRRSLWQVSQTEKDKVDGMKKIDPKAARKDSRYQGYLRALGVKKDIPDNMESFTSEGKKQIRQTDAREQRIKDWAMPEYERRERDQARREARKHKQSIRGMQ
jgi:hypothetical protein